jgi:tRNA threonylcarbamoyl adenosine modification protein YeaZ
MKILAIDFSSPQRSVAVLEAVPAAAGLRWSEVVETGAPQTSAFGMIDRALEETGFGRETIDCLAVGIGPGSYTGIRASIALAQGWELMGGTKLLAISSVETIATEAADSGLVGPAAVLVDAQRNEFYMARYEMGAGAAREIEPLRLVTLPEAQTAAAKTQVIGPEVTRWFPDGRLVFPRAATLARLAMNRSDFLPGESIQPIYLRETKFVKAPPPRVLPPG